MKSSIDETIKMNNVLALESHWHPETLNWLNTLDRITLRVSSKEI